MKIGIITIHKSEVNYGACLQCYALWRYVTAMGHDCEVIDLLRPSHIGYKFKFRQSSIKPLFILLKLRITRLLAMLKDKQIRLRERRYREFNNQVKYSPTFRSAKELSDNPPLYDIYVSGSDQIWNPNMTFEHEPYMLSFAPAGKKRIAYASSFGVQQLPEAVKETYRTYLSSYEHISTREQSGSHLVKEITGREVPVVLDPVFLLSADEWTAVACEDSTIDGDYLLVYSLRDNPRLLSLAMGQAKRMGCKVVLVNADYNVCTTSGVLQLRNVGPRQWLGLIRHTRLFITDSFHGTAFAIIFGTRFLTCVTPLAKTNDRIYTLLSNLGLQGNIISVSTPLDAIPLPTSIYYQPQLKALIDRSKQYLAIAL